MTGEQQLTYVFLSRCSLECISASIKVLANFSSLIFSSFHPHDVASLTATRSTMSYKVLEWLLSY